MERPEFIKKIVESFQVNPAVALLGPRQCGKTTLARSYFASLPGPKYYFDLENPAHLEALNSPMQALGVEGNAVIVVDEVQRRPDLFPILRVLIDENRGSRRFLLLGSASRELIQQASESLAGRISYLELTPFNAMEVKEIPRLWERGGFPLSYLAENLQISFRWRSEYVRTYLEQDIPNLGIRIPPNNLRRLWSMLAHYHGGIVNYSELGKSLDLTHVTIKKYTDILSDTFMIRMLVPWYENISKRQVKSPKVYLRDSGILHNFLGIHSREDLIVHPKLGASWEGFALEELIRFHGYHNEQVFFWASHASAELDLLVLDGSRKMGFEFKYSDAPKISKSMRIAIEDLKLDSLVVIFPGNDKYAMDREGKIMACGLQRYLGLA